MMVLFFHAARLALVTFDPYLGSRPLAEALNRSPEGRLIVDDQYYAFSSVMFYANRRALLLNGRINNIEYGSYAPGAPDVFLDDKQFARLWSQPERYYLVAAVPAVARFEKLVGKRMPIFRAMPNIPVVVEEGATAVAANAACAAEHRRIIEDIFRSVGVVVFVEEEMMHAVTALSGSGPAYIYMVIEAMIAGGLKMGLSREISTRLAEQTVLGRVIEMTARALQDQIATRQAQVTPGSPPQTWPRRSQPGRRTAPASLTAAVVSPTRFQSAPACRPGSSA